MAALTSSPIFLFSSRNCNCLVSGESSLCSEILRSSDELCYTSNSNRSI
jgi:hypothetical protein